MTNSEQAIREKAINIFADIFAAGGEAHEVGGQSFDQLQQSGYIDRKITDLTALISEHYYPKEFTEWLLKQDSYPQDNGGTYFLVNGVAGDDATLLFYHWNKYIKKENER